MHYTHILIRPGELFLKGKNISFFEQKLISNLKKITGLEKVQKLRGRFIIDYIEHHQQIKNVFGVVSYSPAVFAEKDLNQIKSTAVGLLKDKKGSFIVATKRSDKTFPLKSPELNQMVGEYIEDKTELEFSLSPDIKINVEINTKGVFIFTEVVPCFGGLPTGVEGRTLLNIENQNSILAGLLMMKRGCNILPVSSSDKDLSLLQRYSPSQLTLNIFNNNKDIEKYANENNILTIVSGQNYENYHRNETKLVVLRPLVSYSQEEIEKELQMFA